MKDSMVLALVRKGMPLEEADALVAGLEESNPELFVAPVYHAPDGHNAGLGRMENPAAAIPMVQGVTRASGLPIPAINQQELKRLQVAAYVAAGYEFCPNCQQPTHDHLPGCSRRDMGQGKGTVSFGADKRAVTKDPLPPVG